jgi:hypothetical protein
MLSRKRPTHSRRPLLPFAICIFQFALCNLLFSLPLHAAPPEFTARTTEGTTLKGPLHRLALDSEIRLGPDGKTALPASRLLGLAQTDKPRPPLPTAEHLLLVNGDRIPVEKVRLARERLHFVHPDLADGKETSLPLAVVAVLWRGPPDKEPDPERTRHRLEAHPRPRDLLVLRNGDLLQGVLTSLDDREAQVKVGTKSVAVALEQVAALAPSTDLAEPLRTRGPFARLVLAGKDRSSSARLTLTSATCTDGRHLEGTTAFGAKLRVPLSRVVALDLCGGAATCLSDLKPSAYEYRPYLGESRPWTAGRNAVGHDFRLAGASYNRGVGLHAPCHITYELAGKYRRFEALDGLDDRDGRRGGVRLRILADGKPADLGAAGGELTADTGPVRVSVPLAGARKLTLEVDPGAFGNVQDVVNWVEARLVK